MKDFFLALSALAFFPNSAFAEGDKVCAAITHCDIVQFKKEDKKKSTFNEALKFDELCGADEHVLPMRGNRELVLTIAKGKVLGILYGTKRTTMLAKRFVSLKAEKLELAYNPGGKALSAKITCSK